MKFTDSTNVEYPFRNVLERQTFIPCDGMLENVYILNAILRLFLVYSYPTINNCNIVISILFGSFIIDITEVSVNLTPRS